MRFLTKVSWSITAIVAVVVAARVNGVMSLWVFLWLLLIAIAVQARLAVIIHRQGEDDA